MGPSNPENGQLESPIPTLPQTLAAWLEAGADFAVYVICDGKLVYGNAAFQALLGADPQGQQALAGRPRELPGGVPARDAGPSAESAGPLRLPVHTLRLTSRDGASRQVTANEWLMPAQGAALVVGCIDPPREALGPDDAFLRVALHDGLTGLPNRSLLEDRLFLAIARVRRNGRLAALLHADLDGLEAINQRHGREAGDRVLQSASARMQACVRRTDSVARLGGDEFAILLDEPAHVTQVELVAKRLIASVALPIALPDGTSVGVGCSVGIALCPHSGINLHLLMHRAEQALHASKRRGGGQFTLSDEPDEAGLDAPLVEQVEFRAEPVGVPAIDRQHEKLIELANRLHHALEHSPAAAATMSLLDELIGHTRGHFAAEEAMMDRYRDPDAGAHKREHARLIAQTELFRQALASGDSQMVLSALRPWLLQHIERYDRALGGLLRAGRLPQAPP